jgi:glucose-6-phosphate 1-dehydrogenase
LYTRTDALELSWRFIDPILKEWAKDPAKGLTFYPAGSNEPEERKWLLHYSL